MANAFKMNQPALPTLSQVPVVPQKSIAQLMEEQQGLTAPQLKANGQDLMNNLGNIASLRSITPEKMQSFLNSPNFVAASTGFNNAEDLLGMTPENYQKMVMPLQENALQMTQRYQNLADSVTGMPQTKANLSDAAKFNASTNAQNITNSVNNATRTQTDQTKLAQDAMIANNRNALDVYNAETSKWLKGEELANYNMNQAADRALRKELARVSESGNANAALAVKGLENGTLHTLNEEQNAVNALKNIDKMDKPTQGMIKRKAALMGMYGADGAPFTIPEASKSWGGYTNIAYGVKPAEKGNMWGIPEGTRVLWRKDPNTGESQPVGPISKRFDPSILKAAGGGSSSVPYFMTQPQPQ